MSRSHFVFHSPMPPEEAMAALRSAVDEEHWAFSLSGYAGNLPITGKFGDNIFRLRKRVFYNDGVERLFFGRIEAEPGGTRVEAYFAYANLVSFFQIVLVLFGLILFFFKLRIEPLFCAGFAGLCLLLFVVFRWLRSGGEEFLVGYVRDVLGAQLDLRFDV